MSKLTITFDMETERESALHAVYADRYHVLIWEIREICRSVFKYETDPLESLKQIWELTQDENL